VEAAPVDERDLGTIADVDVDLVPRDVLRLPEHDDRPGRPDDRERRLESEARALELLGSPTGEALRSERGLLERMERARDATLEDGEVGEERELLGQRIVAEMGGQLGADVVQIVGLPRDRERVAVREAMEGAFAHEVSDRRIGIRERRSDARR